MAGYRENGKQWVKADEKMGNRHGDGFPDKLHVSDRLPDIFRIYIEKTGNGWVKARPD